MTRLLLYRGKRMDNEEYVYGYYTGYRKIGDKIAHWILDFNRLRLNETHFRSVYPDSLELVMCFSKQETPEQEKRFNMLAGDGYNSLITFEDQL